MSSISLRLFLCITLCFSGSLFFNGCVRWHVSPYEVSGDIDDPLEPFNRYMFEVARFLDFLFIYPSAVLYEGIVPWFIRDAISNVFDNLKEPITLVNDVFQGEWERGGNTTLRILINTTIGVGGIVDVASLIGYEKHQEDFAQTLAIYGMPPGPYLFIPFIGPSSFRDLGGYGVDTLLFDPLTWLSYLSYGIPELSSSVAFTMSSWGVSIMRRFDTRTRALLLIEDIELNSLDSYITTRNYYIQSMRAAIFHRYKESELLHDVLLDEQYLPTWEKYPAEQRP